jgi:hypothetical protein
VTLDQQISHSKTFYNGIHPGTHSHISSSRAMCSNPPHRVNNRPADKSRSVLKHPPLSKPLSTSLAWFQNHGTFIRRLEPIIVRLPCPQMAIVEMEAPFSQINFENSRHQILQCQTHITGIYPSPLRFPKPIVLECVKVVWRVQHPKLFTMRGNHNVTLPHCLRLRHRSTAYSVE